LKPELFNLRVAFIVSGSVFLVSLVTGLLGGALFVTALLRAFVFAAVFFGIVAGIYCLYNKFLLPDDSSGGSAPAVGRNVDYTVDDSDDWFNTAVDTGDVPEDVHGTDGGLEQPDGAEAVGGRTEETPVPPAENDGGALEQSDDKIYTDSKTLASEKPPAASAGYAFDIDMSDFTPDAPMFSGGDEGKAVPLNAAEWRAGTGAGTVDMSVARRPVDKTDLYSDADGKKMAGAIKTLLKKDEG
jgi:hypothetical protein